MNHWLVVEDEDLWIEHPPECPSVEWQGCIQFTCREGFEDVNSGLTSFFSVVGAPDAGEYMEEVVRPGRYLIEPWTETYWRLEGNEYDAGLRLVYPEEAQPRGTDHHSVQQS